MSKFATDITALAELSGRLNSDFGRHELNQLHKAAEALAALAESGKGEQHVHRVTLAGRRFQEHLSRISANLGEREAGGLQALAQARREGLKMETDKTFLPVVTAFQNAPDSATRLKWLEQAAKEGNGAVLAAVSECPHYVTGIDSETLAKYLQHAEARHLPGLAERRQQFNADRQVVHAALRQGEAIAAKAQDLESLEAADAAAKAEQDLDKATG